MSRVSPFGVLQLLGLLTWKTVSTGWERRWTSKPDVESYATERLAHHVDAADLPATAALAMARSLDDLRIADQLQRLSAGESENTETALTKWRLSKLVALREEELGWEEKVDRLEELCAEFGFPPDMQRCSRYATGNQDPLEALNEVIVGLSRQLTIVPLDES